GRNYLTGRDGDRINAVLAAAGYNFSLLLRRFEELLRVLSLILWRALLATPLHLTRCRKTFFTADALRLYVWERTIGGRALRIIPTHSATMLSARCKCHCIF